MDKKPAGSPDPNSQAPVNPTNSTQSVKPTGPVVVGQTATNEVGTVEPTVAGTATTESAQAEPKKKTGLIVGIVIGVIVLIGACVGVAFALMNLNKPDPVVGALNKLMSEGTSSNVVANGEIELNISGANSLPISGAAIKFNSEVLAGSVVNSSRASLKLTMTNNDTLLLDIDEMYASSGDLYFKLGGVKDVILNYILSFDADADSEDVSSEYSAIADVIAQKLEDKWLRISSEELESYIKEANRQSNITCLTDMISDAKSNQNAIAEMYNKNPFVISTSENIKIAKRRNPIYKINVDSEKFVSFTNSLSNSDLMQAFYNCVGVEDEDVTINEDKIKEMVSEIPDLYVEIDEDYNITRLYFESQITNVANTVEEGLILDDDQSRAESSAQEIEVDCMVSDDDCESIEAVTFTIKTDLLFDYPTTLNIDEPTEYEDFSTVINNLFNNLYLD